MADERLVKNPSVVCTEMADGAVLLDLDTTHYYSLNSTGLQIWNLIDQHPSVDAIADQLVHAYEVDLPHARASTETIVRTLEQERLISRQR